MTTIQMLETLAQLYRDGADIRWDAVAAPQPRVVLPSYPFQRKPLLV